MVMSWAAGRPGAVWAWLPGRSAKVPTNGNVVPWLPLRGRTAWKAGGGRIGDDVAVRQNIRFGRVAGIAGRELVGRGHPGTDGLAARHQHPPWLVSAPLTRVVVGGRCGGAVLFLASLLAHEISHSLVARCNAVRVRPVALADTRRRRRTGRRATQRRRRLRIALAGPAASPAASLAAAAIFLAAAVLLETVNASGVAVAAAQWLAFVNALLAVFNLAGRDPVSVAEA